MPRTRTHRGKNTEVVVIGPAASRPCFSATLNVGQPAPVAALLAPSLLSLHKHACTMGKKLKCDFQGCTYTNAYAERLRTHRNAAHCTNLAFVDTATNRLVGIATRKDQLLVCFCCEDKKTFPDSRRLSEHVKKSYPGTTLNCITSVDVATFMVTHPPAPPTAAASPNRMPSETQRSNLDPPHRTSVAPTPAALPLLLTPLPAPPRCHPAAVVAQRRRPAPSSRQQLLQTAAALSSPSPSSACSTPHRRKNRRTLNRASQAAASTAATPAAARRHQPSPGGPLENQREAARTNRDPFYPTSSTLTPTPPLFLPPPLFPARTWHQMAAEPGTPTAPPAPVVVQRKRPAPLPAFSSSTDSPPPRKKSRQHLLESPSLFTADEDEDEDEPMPIVEDPSCQSKGNVGHAAAAPEDALASITRSGSGTSPDLSGSGSPSSGANTLRSAVVSERDHPMSQQRPPTRDDTPRPEAEGEPSLRRSTRLRRPPLRKLQRHVACDSDYHDSNDGSDYHDSNNGSDYHDGNNGNNGQAPCDGDYHKNGQASSRHPDSSLEIDRDEEEVAFPVPRDLDVLLAKLGLRIVPLKHLPGRGLIICTHDTCKKGINPSKAIDHAISTSQDKYYGHAIEMAKPDSDALKTWIKAQGHNLVAHKDQPEHPPENSRALPHLAMSKGVRCMTDNSCRLVFGKEDTLRNHAGNDHPRMPVRWKVVDIQCYFKGGGTASAGIHTYFEVLPPRPGPRSKLDLFAIYLNTYPERGDDAARTCLLYGQDRKEMPLFLQITGFPDHLFDHIKKDARDGLPEDVDDSQVEGDMQDASMGADDDDDDDRQPEQHGGDEQDGPQPGEEEVGVVTEDDLPDKMLDLIFPVWDEDEDDGDVLPEEDASDGVPEEGDRNRNRAPQRIGHEEQERWAKWGTLVSKNKTHKLRAIINPPQTKAARKAWTGTKLNDTIRCYMTVIRDGVIRLDYASRKLLTRKVHHNRQVAWQPVSYPKTVGDYARVLHKLTYGVATSLSLSNETGYTFPLTEEDKNNLRALERKLTGARSKPSDAVQEFHNFIRPFLYPREQLEDAAATTSSFTKWNHPLECFIALYALNPDGTFDEPKNMTKLFAILHHHMSGAIYWEAKSSGSGSRTMTGLVQAIDGEAKKNFGPTSLSPYNFCAAYQALASSIAHNSGSAPSTRVSTDGKLITYREVRFEMEPFRVALKAVHQEILDLLRSICSGVDLDGLMPQEPVADDWAECKAGYSWVNNVSLQNKNVILEALFCDLDRQLVHPSRDGKTCTLNIEALTKLASECALLNRKLSMFTFFTIGQPCRLAEFLEGKLSNSLRPRAIFIDDESCIWVVTRNVKWENVANKEAFIPMKSHPVLSDLLKKYLLFVRPVEVELIRHLVPESKQSAASLTYATYMWVEEGTRVGKKAMREHVADFLQHRCGFKGANAQAYRQIAVQITKTYFPVRSQDVLEDDRRTTSALQRGHSTRAAQHSYAAEEGHLAGMSADVLLRYGEVSELWWEVVGFKPGAPPMVPWRTLERERDPRSLTEALSKRIDALNNKLDRLLNVSGLGRAPGSTAAGFGR
ncbi:hypothetical protein BDZ97DRAFT_1914276 [Flammula alnicola]|nr:hypothetical protein BDZ97DRAFT_1914276 [Flammula alnicola]